VCIDVSTLECRAAAGIEEAIPTLPRAQVNDVWTGGRCAVSEGRLLAFDAERSSACRGAGRSG
jgi:hypothetical protein